MAACDNPANIAAESRCQVVDDIPSQDQLADEMLARPEIRQNLNNTWHVTLNCTPF